MVDTTSDAGIEVYAGETVAAVLPTAQRVGPLRTIEVMNDPLSVESSPPPIESGTENEESNAPVKLQRFAAEPLALEPPMYVVPPISLVTLKGVPPPSVVKVGTASELDAAPANKVRHAATLNRNLACIMANLRISTRPELGPSINQTRP